MNTSEVLDLLEAVRTGQLDLPSASERILQALRAAPFEDLAFARIDTHRRLRQGFPEVVLGIGKTPAQIAAIAARIAGDGEPVLVTRAEPEAYEAVRAGLPAAIYHPVARAITLSQGKIPAGHGTILIACAGTSDLPVAEEAAVTAELMGNTIDRLYDVGVAGLHRLLREQARLESARVVYRPPSSPCRRASATVPASGGSPHSSAC